MKWIKWLVAVIVVSFVAYWAIALFLIATGPRM